VVVAAVCKVRVPEVDPESLTPENVGVEVVAISWGKVKVTDPVEAEAITWLEVPVKEMTPVLARLTDPPKETEPPPDKPDPGEMVIADDARSEFDIVPSRI